MTKLSPLRLSAGVDITGEGIFTGKLLGSLDTSIAGGIDVDL
jgi:hypothetical protein